MAAEARAAAAILQPHAVAVYDSGEHDGVPYIVMERLPGDTLADRLATGPVLSGAEARTFGRQVLGALDAAHRVGMVHRDVKPGNVLLTGEGSAKIADFGIAKSIELSADGADLTGTGQLIGTPAYIAPEQLQGEPASPLSDLYALGVVLYEALAGCKPYEADNAMVAARAVIQGDHVPLGTLRPDLDDDLVRAVERAMDRDPGARFPSAAAMGAALAPPAVPTIVPAPGDLTGVGPDRTQVLDVDDLAAATAAAATTASVASAPSGAEGVAQVPPAAAVPPTTAAPVAAARTPLGGTGGPVVAAPPPDVDPTPLAGRRRPSFRLRLGLAALAVVSVVILLAQVLRPDSADDLVESVAKSAATTPTTVAPTTTVTSPGATVAGQLRDFAGGLGGGNGAAAADLAGRMRTVADLVERGDLTAAGTATGLIVDVARWYQAGQLTDITTVAALQLLQKVPGVAVAGSAPAAAAPPPAAAAAPEVFVPNPAVTDKPAKEKGKQGN
jgi:serine/threonine-protein kinase